MIDEYEVKQQLEKRYANKRVEHSFFGEQLPREEHSFYKEQSPMKQSSKLAESYTAFYIDEASHKLMRAELK